MIELTMLYIYIYIVNTIVVRNFLALGLFFSRTRFWCKRSRSDFHISRIARRTTCNGSIFIRVYTSRLVLVYFRAWHGNIPIRSKNIGILETMKCSVRTLRRMNHNNNTQTHSVQGAKTGWPFYFLRTNNFGLYIWSLASLVRPDYHHHRHPK